MAVPEALDGRGQDRRRDRGQGGDGDPPAAPLDELRELAEGALELAEDAAGDRRQFATGRRELDVARVAIEQARADAVLDLSDGAAERRLRHVERASGLGEAAQLRDAQEDSSD